MRRGLPFLLPVVALLLAACSLPSQMKPTSEGGAVALAPGGSDTRIQLALGEDLVLRLPSNPSTGYRWSLAAGLAGALQPAGAPVFEAAATAPKQVGASGYEVWRFKSVQPGEETLRFEYRRVWEKDVPAAQTVSYEVTVR